MPEHNTKEAFDVNAWLHETIEDGGEPRWRRLAYLVTANGGFSVYGWGILSSFKGHRRGLDQDEALELISYKGFCDGLHAAGVDIYGIFHPLFKDYIKECGISTEEAEDGTTMEQEKEGFNAQDHSNFANQGGEGEA